MSRRSRWIFGTLAAVAVILIAVLILFDWNWLKGPLESQVAGRLGRPLRIHGDLEVELSRRPRIVVENAELANAPWGSDAPMVRIDRAEVVIDLLELLRGEILLPAVSIGNPDLLLQNRPDGPPNWQFGPSDEATPEPPALPRIGRLEVSDASIRYHDLGSGRNVTAELTQIAGNTDGSLKLIAVGTVQGQPLDLQITGAPLGQLETPAEPYPASLALKLGRSDLRGDLTVDLSGPRPFISTELESDRLRLQDLTATPADQPPPPSASDRSAEPIPPSDAPESAAIIAAAGINFGALPEIDVDVQFRGGDLQAPGVRFARLELDLKLRDRVAVIDAAGEGTFRERQPVTFEIHAGTEDSLENPETRYPLDVSLHSGSTHATARGTVDRPLNYTGLNVDVSLQGPDLDQLGELLALPLPATPPYELAGKITHQEQEMRWNLVALSGTVGDSDIEGDVSLELGGQRPTVVADLQSETLDLDDLGVLVGAPPGTGPGETASREQREQAAREAAANAPVLPDQPFDMPEMRAIDARISFTGESVQAMKVPLEQMDAKLTLEAGDIRIDPVRVGVAGGQIEAAIGLDAQDVLIGDLDLTVRNVKLNQLLAAFKLDVGEIEMTKEGVGTFGGWAKLTVEGNSIHGMAAAANGDVAVVMGGGQINALVIEALGLDVGEILAVVAAGAEEKEGGMVPVQCFVSQFDVQDGVMTTRALVLETSDSTVTGSGKIDLGEETLDLRLLAHPKDASVLTASTPVGIQGTFRDPKIDVVSKELEEKGLAALALGVVLPVIGAIFPFIETGDAEGANCAALMKAAQDADGDSQGSTTRR